MRRFKFFTRVLFAVALLLSLKLLVDSVGWDVIPINTLTGAFFGGVFFTISIVFAGAMTDYKEAEKIPGEMAVLFKALRNDAHLLELPNIDKSIVSSLQNRISALLSEVIENFRDNRWHKKDLDKVMNEMNADILTLLAAGAPVGPLLKIRDHLTGLDRLSHRIDAMKETSFIPTAYAMVELAVAAVLMIFVFAKNEWAFGGTALLGAISFVLISIVLLIKDMDNPFEYGANTYADVDLTVLFKLESLWRDPLGKPQAK